MPICTAGANSCSSFSVVGSWKEGGCWWSRGFTKDRKLIFGRINSTNPTNNPSDWKQTRPKQIRRISSKSDRHYTNPTEYKTNPAENFAGFVLLSTSASFSHNMLRQLTGKLVECFHGTPTKSFLHFSLHNIIDLWPWQYSKWKLMTMKMTMTVVDMWTLGRSISEWLKLNTSSIWYCSIHI